GFMPPADARWQTVAAAPGGGEVICHNDLAPWNTVFVGQRPVAFIDWDMAAPGPRRWDVAYALWHFVPLYGDEESDPFPVDVFEPRGRRTRLFCDAYELSDREGLVDTIIDRQFGMRTMVEKGAEAGDPALQRLWDLGAPDGIKRQVDYVERHRTELERALD
ncbi:MAG: phosphotransferase, partial [Actinobacteria bacterium]|nr:phosphotransferase [Actinomycetota bacterium]